MKKDFSAEPLEWRDEYNVNIGFIDEQHKKFLDILNQLKLVITERSCAASTSQVFFALANYTEQHLIQEEIYLKDYQYPGFSQHKESHNQFIQRLVKFQEDFQENKPRVCEEMHDYLLDWFENHILKYDKDAIAFLRSKGA
jgi:hemerythrin